MQTDLQLLTQYHQRGDAPAFRELMEAHAPMVLATAKRVTQDPALAEDVAQETFLQLARHSRSITESVAAWLHRVAWRRACNLVRADSTRRRYEHEASAIEASTSESSWAEVEVELDAVIDDLPEELRGPLVMHFLEGRSQREIAKHLRVSQSTVSRAVDSGITELRTRLKSKGLICGAGLVAMLLSQASSAAAAGVPTSLTLSLGKLSMAGFGGVPLTVPPVWWSSPLVKAGAVATVLVSGVLVTSTMTHRDAEAGAPVALRAADTPAPAVPSPEKPLSSPGPSAAPVTLDNLPVHELVHSFPTTPQNPRGYLALDKDGWLWGAMPNAGDYGQGLIYKVRPDGTGWESVFSFNGHDGSTGPVDGLLLTQDGCLWGVTNGRDEREPSTLFEFDPRNGNFTVKYESMDRRLTIRPVEGPDGQIWGTTNAAVYRFDRTKGELKLVLELTGNGGPYPGNGIRGSLVDDGRGYLWGTAAAGGRFNQGTVFKLHVETGKATTVVEFTGRSGAFRGEQPRAALTLDQRGFLWGTTRGIGSNRRADHHDGGSIFKVHAETGAFTHVTDFIDPPGAFQGRHPETALLMDGNGQIWGTTTYGGTHDCGTVFKLDPISAQLTTVVHFTSAKGNALGKSPRGHLLADAKGGAIGVCEYGGHGFLGTLYRVDLTSGGFKLLTDISALENANEGSAPQGGLASGSDGWLWGTASMNGSHYCGTVFKVDPVTNTLLSVANFTGSDGPHRGRYPCATLHHDGNGFLWGTTREGGRTGWGTVFKVNEATGELTTVLDFHSDGNNVRGGTRSELIPDGKGWLWSCTYSTWFHIMGEVYKINTTTGEILAISRFEGDKGPRFGRGPGVLANDGLGFMWGASMADHQRTRSSLFKIDIQTNKRTTMAHFFDCAPGSGFQSMGDMHRDANGCLWFTAVIDGGSRRAGHALVKVNPSTGQVEGRYRQRGFAELGSPISDEQGILWGTTPNGGDESRGSIYAFDPRTERFSTVMSFTGNGSQPRSGSAPHVSKLVKHTDGNFYAVTRYGGPGGNGTVYRLRFGPSPMTQEATLLANGTAELHGTLRPNGRESTAEFEWGTDATLSEAKIVPAGTIPAGHSSKAVSATVSGLKPGVPYYFRLRGTNAANSIPQRGAILRFTLPQADTLADGGTAGDESLVSAASQPERNGVNARTKHALKIVRIPGAGAGFVRGAVEGSVYEVGKPYSLQAISDNGYVFDHWTGPGISGAQAENPSLSFVYTEALAGSPVITATFIRNPFRDENVGRFDGLISNAETSAPDVSNTGAVHFTVSRNGSFSGKLLYDSTAIALTGRFDSGGLAGLDRRDCQAA